MLMPAPSGNKKVQVRQERAPGSRAAQSGVILTWEDVEKKLPVGAWPIEEAGNVGIWLEAGLYR